MAACNIKKNGILLGTAVSDGTTSLGTWAVEASTSASYAYTAPTAALGAGRPYRNIQVEVTDGASAGRVVNTAILSDDGNSPTGVLVLRDAVPL